MKWQLPVVQHLEVMALLPGVVVRQGAAMVDLAALMRHVMVLLDSLVVRDSSTEFRDAKAHLGDLVEQPEVLVGYLVTEEQEVQLCDHVVKEQDVHLGDHVVKEQEVHLPGGGKATGGASGYPRGKGAAGAPGCPADGTGGTVPVA
ncbi:hypothetical protein MRX96_017727 [Rhipicephalus microplus]